MKIVLACGGSGGHIFPAFSVAEELKKRHPGSEIIYVCGKKGIESQIFKPLVKERVFSIDSAPFGGLKSLGNPRFLIKLAAGTIQSLRFLEREKPDIVVGFGGYYSFPILIAAKIKKIRTAVHEQNVLPGVANRALCRIVDGTALSFEESAPALKGARLLRVTGNPIRESIEKHCRQEAIAFFGFDPEKFTLLVVGGSQGAESLNTVFMECLPFLSDTWRRQFQVLHLCGKMSPEESQERCRKAGIFCRAYSFFDRMELAYSAAHAALGRAGATFLAEVAVKGIPVLLLPYPYGSGHQMANAKAFARHHNTVLLNPLETTPRELAMKLETLKNRQPIPGSFTEARKRLADFVEELAR
ncbi:MAG: UDP-N-acetylglucosamine--N-acetylmuramyl-(pentapeptide) pyrophosphoryl-undecaprenol N-acetylglucosamine transferase [Candidatus Omnitrophica bacterium]|nr:UDP-N-acetylglucosamine--N-acetylmuramyl-(pentapeptide) pyrophosphoryl-undecaprenol N-acetylglucosamine transferase [Candidatus Omnitrophota bacterium]